MSLRPRSVTYGKSFLRAFTRQKRYLTCVNFPFLSSPRDGSRTVSRIVHSPEFSEFIQRGDGTESKLMSLVGSHWEIVATGRLKSIIRSGKRTFAMIPQQRSAARRLPHAGVVFALETSRSSAILRVEQKALRQTGGDAETLTKQLRFEVTVNRVVTPAPAKQLPDRANAGRAS